MINSMYIAATGMHTQQQMIDIIANNLANMNTPGFKKSRVSFEDLMYGKISQTNGLPGAEEGNLSLGLGTAIANSQKIFSLGDLNMTEGEFDFAIRGNGFFEVVMPDGTYSYTRTGSFQIDEDRTIVTSDGYPISPMIEVPSDAEELIVLPDGEVKAKIAGDSELLRIGQLELARFVNPSGLEPSGNNLYSITHESGDALYTAPGENGSGLIAQGFLETSNVELVEELSQLMLAQRAYEVNSRVIQASDELLSIVNNLRR